MAKPQEVDRALALMHRHRPIHHFEEINKSEMGVFAVIRYLHERENVPIDGTKAKDISTRVAVTSKEISDALGVSSARMTVVLKKLEQKGLIVKTSSQSDARAICVTLSEKGDAYAMQLRCKIYHTMERVVDEFGIEEVEKLFVMVSKIHDILYETRPTQLEDDYV